MLQFKSPTPQTENLFEASFNATLERYRLLLKEEGEGRLHLSNDNFDLGEQAGPGKYRLSDEAHARLLHNLALQNFQSAPPRLRKALLELFASPDAPYAMKNNPKAWAQVQQDLAALKSLPDNNESGGSSENSH